MSGLVAVPAAILRGLVLLAGVAGGLGWAAGRASTVPRLRALQRVATRDLLTGLANRRGLAEAADRTLTGAGGTGVHALMVIDLDGFKKINDVNGHLVGDQVLAQAAERLQRCARGLDPHHAVAARLGGDEFALLLRLPAVPASTTGDRIAVEALAAGAAAAIWRALSQPYAVPAADRLVSVGASVGIAVTAASGGGTGLSRLLDRADAAMYAAKRRGGGWDVLDGTGLAQPPVWSRPPDNLRSSLNAPNISAISAIGARAASALTVVSGRTTADCRPGASTARDPDGQGACERRAS